jgi:hypothetical protein
MTAPRLVLAAMLVAAALGAYLRWSPRAATPEREAKIAVPAQQRMRSLVIGGFLVEGVGDRERQSLRLRAPNCRWPIFVTPAHVFGAAAEKLIAIRYPASWRTLYVYRGQTSEKFTRFAALQDFLIGRVKAQITLAPLDPVDMIYLTFHASEQCDFDPAALAEASRGLILLMTHAPG